MNPIIIFEILIGIMALIFILTSDISPKIYLENSNTEDIYASLLSIYYYAKYNNITTCDGLLPPLTFLSNSLFNNYTLIINNVTYVNNSMTNNYAYNFIYVLYDGQNFTYCNVTILR